VVINLSNIYFYLRVTAAVWNSLPPTFGLLTVRFQKSRLKHLYLTACCNWLF